MRLVCLVTLILLFGCKSTVQDNQRYFDFKNESYCEKLNSPSKNLINLAYNYDDNANAGNMVYVSEIAIGQLLAQSIINSSERKTKLRKKEDAAKERLHSINPSLVNLDIPQINLKQEGYCEKNVYHLINFTVNETLDSIKLTMLSKVDGFKSQKSSYVLPISESELKKMDSMMKISKSMITHLIESTKSKQKYFVDSSDCTEQRSIKHIQGNSFTVTRGQICEENKNSILIKSLDGSISIIDKEILY